MRFAVRAFSRAKVAKCAKPSAGDGRDGGAFLCHGVVIDVADEFVSFGRRRIGDAIDADVDDAGAWADVAGCEEMGAVWNGAK